MSDLIDRQVAIDMIAKLPSTMSVCLSLEECGGMKRMQRMVIRKLDEIPSVTPKQKEGYWMREGISNDALLSKIITCTVNSFDNDGMDICSECGSAYRDALIRFKFCPNCGAQMS